MRKNTKSKDMKSNLLLLLASLLPAAGHAHEHLAAGATAPNPGATLVLQNLADYGEASGYAFNLGAGTTNDAYLGYYYTGDLVFVALAATPNYGGPEPGAAALGAFVQIQLLSVEGPPGASFGFWETTQDGVDSTDLTWSVPVPYTNGHRLIPVSEGDGTAGADPYGHLHGRIYSVTRPGLYKTTWQFVDTSANGPAGHPVELPSAPFSLFLQADLTLGRVVLSTNGLALTFAAPSNIPDSGDGPATNYRLEASPVLGPAAAWTAVGDVVVGDDHLHTVTVPWSGSTRFFRLSVL